MSFTPHRGVFHAYSSEQADEGEDTHGEWCDIDTGTTEEWERALSKHFAHARSNGTTDAGAFTLHDLPQKYTGNVRIHCDEGPPAKVRPLELKLNDHAHPVRVK